MKELRKIDFEKEKYFECGGKKYRIIDDPGFIRFRVLQEISLEFGFSSTFLDIFNSLTVCYDVLNKGQFADSAVRIYNLLEGVKRASEKYDPALRLCTLFIIEENEDLLIWDEGLAKAKIDCWAKELEVGPFFNLAASLVEGWSYAYEIRTLNGLKKEKEDKN